MTVTYKGFQIEIAENSDQRSEFSHEYHILNCDCIVQSGLAISADNALELAQADIDFLSVDYWQDQLDKFSNYSLETCTQGFKRWQHARYVLDHGYIPFSMFANLDSEKYKRKKHVPLLKTSR